MKKIVIFLLIFMFFSSTLFIQVGAISLINIKKPLIEKNNLIDDQLAIWKKNDYWKYDLDFNFKYKDTFRLEGKIKNLKFEVTDILENEYKLKITGTLDSDLNIYGIDLIGFDGDVTGNAIVKKSNLAIKNYFVKSDGGNFLLSTHAELRMNYDSPFDFLDLPILTEEDKNNPWNANTYGDLTGIFTIKIFGVTAYSYPIIAENIFKNEKLHFEKHEEHQVPAGTFNSYKISGNLAPKYNGESYLWYSPEAGFLIDLYETGCGSEGSEMSLRMKLKSTNYEEPETNNPPNKPSNPVPANHATNANIDTILSWTGGDPNDCDSVTYDVYFGKDSTPDSGELVSEKQDDNSYITNTLEPNTKYYWKIIAYDNNGEKTKGDIWDFTTGEGNQNSPPSRPLISGPSKVEVLNIETFNIVSTDPDGDLIYYAIYLFKDNNNAGGVANVGESGVEIKQELPFLAEGNYQIRVKATDNISGWSEWGTYSVTCPKIKIFNFLQSDLIRGIFNSFSNII